MSRRAQIAGRTRTTSHRLLLGLSSNRASCDCVKRAKCICLENDWRQRKFHVATLCNTTSLSAESSAADKRRTANHTGSRSVQLGLLRRPRLSPLDSVDEVHLCRDPYQGASSGTRGPTNEMSRECVENRRPPMMMRRRDRPDIVVTTATMPRSVTDAAGIMSASTA